jgi:hypothetical protein
MIFMCELSSNYVKSLDYRCELVIEVRTQTGNELLEIKNRASSDCCKYILVLEKNICLSKILSKL